MGINISSWCEWAQARHISLSPMNKPYPAGSLYQIIYYELTENVNIDTEELIKRYFECEETNLQKLFPDYEIGEANFSFQPEFGDRKARFVQRVVLFPKSTSSSHPENMSKKD